MEFKVSRETISTADCIYEGIQEQGIELDYILPDYYPDVFRLVRYEVNPVAADYSVNGDKLSYELKCDIKIMYCSENGSVLQCVNQKQTYTKNVELGRSCENITVKLNAKCDYVNCRAVNKRRLDLRGAVSVKIRAEGEKQQEIVCDVSGMNVQLKKTDVKFASDKICVKRNIQLSEDIEITSVQPSVISIVRCSCGHISCEKKNISGKLLAKGDVSVNVLYACEKDGEGSLEPMEFIMPYSQIIDVEHGNEDYEFDVKPEIVFCDVVPVQSGDGENRTLRCEAELTLCCNAVKSRSAVIASDAYSTTYPCNISMSDIKLEQIPVSEEYSVHHSFKMLSGEDMPEKVYYVWCSPKNVNAVLSDDRRKLTISGMLTYVVACRDCSGMIAMPDKDEAFEEIIELDNNFSGDAVTAEIYVNDASYNISADNSLILTADMKAEISVYKSAYVKAVSDISVDGEIKKIRDGDYSIKLYYGTENEDVWEIAKRYSTCVDAIIDENELDGDCLEQSGMLIIPIVS